MLVHRMAVTLEAGTLVADRYRLDRLLGQGGMGVVWAATHAVTRRTVAMKFVRSTLQQRAELRGRLLREAHAAAAVRHPNVVEILDVFELDADTPVIVMTLLEGETLGQRLAREQPLPLPEAASILLPAISAIGTAHARGVVHRDLKPDNIYLSRGPEGTSVKVLDFGIAKLQDSERVPRDVVATQTGSTLGTPSYMAPEQASGERDVDHRTDIWALGVIAYECLSGMRPIEGDNAAQVIMRLMTTGITPLSRVTRGLPKDVSTLVDRMLARERPRRLQDLREAKRVLSQYTEISVQDFGAPCSELSTAFERDSRRTSVPVTMASEGDDVGPTLVNSGAAVPSPHRGRTPVVRPGRWLVRGSSVVLASCAVAAVAWSLVSSPAQQGRVVLASPNGAVSTLTVAASASAKPPVPPPAPSASAIASTPAVASPTPKPSPPATHERQPWPAFASASSVAALPSVELAVSPPPVPASSAPAEKKAPGIVVEVPF